MKERSMTDAYTALDVITCQIQDTDVLGTSCAEEVREVLEDYFALVKHLKNTPLWDVLTYEDRLEIPLRIVTTDNERLKKENNKLLRELKRTEKYRIHEEQGSQFSIGDFVWSKVLNAAGTVSRASPNDYIIVEIAAKDGSLKSFACRPEELVLIERKCNKK